MTIEKKEWKQPVLTIISRNTTVMGGADPYLKEVSILGSKNGANPITFTVPASKGGHFYTRQYTKNHYLS